MINSTIALIPQSPAAINPSRREIAGRSEDNTISGCISLISHSYMIQVLSHSSRLSSNIDIYHIDEDLSREENKRARDCICYIALRIKVTIDYLISPDMAHFLLTVVQFH
jgi:hypothetical protein